MRLLRSHADIRLPAIGEGDAVAAQWQMKNRSRLSISCDFISVCPGQGLIYENIYKQLKFEYIYNVLKYSILKLYAVKCILSVFSCFAKMRTQCGHESIAVFEYKSYLCRA